MRRIFLSAMALAISAFVFAKTNVMVEEPEFLNSFVYLTTDSTYKRLPKEGPQFKKHESKGSKWAKLASGAAQVASAAGAGVFIGSNSVGAMLGGLQAMNAASGVASAAVTLDALTGLEGLDMVLEGKASTYSIPSGRDVRIIYRAESNATDPADLIRVVQFKQGKKDRKIQWRNVSSALLDTDSERKNGYLYFDASKFGESSYLITIPAETLQPGEYGIISSGMAESSGLPIVTFSIPE